MKKYHIDHNIPHDPLRWKRIKVIKEIEDNIWFSDGLSDSTK